MANSYRFTDCTFDAASGELRNGGSVTRLQPQAAAVLVMLLDAAGTVVSRADLKARLWPDTTVEFDDGLNFCVRQIRLALNDVADAPRFIETLPRRGYRFMPPVTVGGPGQHAAAAMPGTPARWVWRLAVAAGVIFLAALALRAIQSRSAATGKGPGVVLAVLPFSVDTADAALRAYGERLLAGVTTATAGEHGWRMVAGPDGPAPESQALAAAFFKQLEQTAGASHILSGSLIRKENSVSIFVRLVQMPEGRNIWADSIVDAYAFSGNSTLTADRIARSVARLIGSTPSR